MAEKKVLWSGEGAKWEPLKDAPPGNMVSTIWGDVTKGPYGALIKFPAGMKAPLHYHTNDVRIVVVKGAYIYTPEGGSKQRFGPGSFVSYPGGDRHATNGDDTSETIFFIEQPGKFDLKMI